MIDVYNGKVEIVDFDGNGPEHWKSAAGTG